MSTLVNLAKALAFHYHKDQKYGYNPYTAHLNDVVDNCRLYYGDEDTILCVAYLHDILEDTTCDPAILLELFGGDILGAVDTLTKYPQFNQTYKEYIEKVKSNEISLKVKYCDTLANLSQSAVDVDYKRIQKYSRQLDLLSDAADLMEGGNK
jgi:(p)ppGpp synthase/HD superfamily hydrolase